MMIYRFWPAWLPAAFLVLACSRQPIASSASRFVATPPVIDGLATDWTDSLHYDPASKLQYALLNDNRTVYVRLKAADPATQARLLRLGFVVWLDTTGRNQEQFGVRFPLSGRTEGAMPPRADDATRTPANRSTRMRETLVGLREMELLHYKGSKEPTLTDTQSQLGVKLAVNLDDQDNFIYELAVPMRLLYRRLPALANGKTAVVGMTLAGNKWTGPMASPGGSGMGGGIRGGGMRGGGGMGGGGMRAGGGMRGGGMRGGGYSGGSAPLSLKTSVQLSSK